jgi:hypothetical protein
MKIYREVLVSERLPKISGRYIFLVEEQNDLGLSKFLWNCYFDKDINEIRDNGTPYNAKYWLEEIEVELDSERIFPKEFRWNGKDELDERCAYILPDYHKALEAAELEILDSKTKRIKLGNIAEQCLDELNLLKQDADERYKKALEYLSRMWNYEIEDVKSTMSKNYMLEALKIAAYGK